MSNENERKTNAVTLWIARAAVTVSCTIGVAYLGQIKEEFKNSMDTIKVDLHEMRTDFKDMRRYVDQHEAELKQHDKAIDRIDRQKADRR